MAFNERRENATKKSSALEDSAALAQPIDNSRRRFTRSGIAASGVLLTLASQSVMATTISKSPSGFLSGNKSCYGPEPISCGRSPGYWVNHSSSWPISTSTRFKNVFNCSSTSVYAKYTMMQLLTPRQDDKNNLGMHLVAALLNVRKGWTPFLTEERIKSMFSEWQAKGYFSPVANVKWNAAQIVSYLKATQA